MSDWLARKLGQQPQQPGLHTMPVQHVPGIWPGAAPQYQQQPQQYIQQPAGPPPEGAGLTAIIEYHTHAGHGRLDSKYETSSCPQCGSSKFFTFNTMTGGGEGGGNGARITNVHGQQVTTAPRCFDCGYSERFGRYLTEKGL